MIRTHNLSKRYPDGTLALDALEVEVPPGTIYCLLGGSGSGKTTAVRLMLGLVPPTAGRVELAGQGAPQPGASAVYLPSRFPFYDRLTALENLALFAGLGGPAPGPEKLEDALRQVGLPERIFDRRVETLSPGQGQKLALAVALVRDVAIWILDEPLLGLDPGSAHDLVEQLIAARERRKAIFWATQDLIRAKQVADRVGILDSGRLVSTYDRDELGYLDLEELYLGYSLGDQDASSSPY